RIWDASNPPGARVRRARAFLRELSDDGIDAVIARADRPAASLSYAFLEPLGGAVADRDDMALEIPDADWACHCVGLWPPVPALDHGQLAWVDGFAEAVEPFALAAAHVGAASERRLAVKRRYDPRGVFG